MSPRGSREPRRAREGAIAFLLAQLGAHAAGVFAQRLEPLGLTPPQAGVLRRLASTPGQSQRALADGLGMHAPRLVALIDDLQERGLVQRSRNPDDRRNYSLALTEAGERTLKQVSAVARDHDRAITAAVDDDEHAQLAAWLGRIAEEQGLSPGVHPGFRRLGRQA